MTEEINKRTVLGHQKTDLVEGIIKGICRAKNKVCKDNKSNK